MLDFASALYLDMQHASDTLAPWARLTRGEPAATASDPRADAAAAALARLQGCEAAVLAASTLHAFWDLGGLVGAGEQVVLLDAGSYPIARWGAERAAGRGVRVVEFAHHDARALGKHAARLGGAMPLVVCDGFCAACGRAAPLPAYARAIESAGGWLLVDDTQALGILGASPSAREPWGHGGGGSVCWWGLGYAHVLLVSSLAKAFGVPIATVAGPAGAVARYRALSDTRSHCSPPSAAAIEAALAALARNSRMGGTLRARLALRIARLRAELAQVGLSLRASGHPVQTLATPCAVGAVHRELARRGVRAVLHGAHGERRARLSFLVRASHRAAELRVLARILRESIDLHPAPVAAPAQR